MKSLFGSATFSSVGRCGQIVTFERFSFKNLTLFGVVYSNFIYMYMYICLHIYCVYILRIYIFVFSWGTMFILLELFHERLKDLSCENDEKLNYFQK